MVFVRAQICIHLARVTLFVFFSLIEKKTNEISFQRIYNWNNSPLTFDSNELVKIIFCDFQVTKWTFTVDAFFKNTVQLLSGDWCLRRYIYGYLQLEQILILTEIQKEKKNEKKITLVEITIYVTTKAFSKASHRFVHLQEATEKSQLLHCVQFTLCANVTVNVSTENRIQITTHPIFTIAA